MPESLLGELSLALAAMGEGLTVTEASGELLFSNRAAAQILGFDSAESLLAIPMAQVLGRLEFYDGSGARIPLHQLPGPLAMQGRPPPPQDVRIRTLATDAERWANVTAIPVLDAQGRIYRVVILYREITAQRRALEGHRFLAEASALLSASLDQGSTLQTLVRLAVPRLADWCALELRDEDGTQWMVGVAHQDPGKESLARALVDQYPVAEQLREKILRTRQPVLLQDIPEELLRRQARDPEHLRLLLALGFRSAMIVPLVAQERVIGMLTLALAESGRRFDGEDLTLATELVGRTALAVDNARLYERARLALRRRDEEARINEALVRLSVTFALELDPATLAQRIVDESRELLGARFGTFFTTNARGQGQAEVLFACAGEMPDAIARLSPPRATALFATTFRGDRTIRCDDVRMDPRYRQGALSGGFAEGAAPVISFLAAPVTSRSGEALGGMFFGHPGAGAFTAESEALLEGLAAQAAVALDNARLFERLRLAEEKSRTGEERLQLALDAGRLGHWEWSPRTRLLSFSPATERMHGLAVGAYDGTVAAHRRLIHPEDWLAVERAIHDPMADPEGDHRVQYRVLLPDGALRWINSRGKLSRDEQGQPQRFLGICTDVTDRVEAEHAKLAQAEELARSNAELEHFAYVASHDLQEPLRMVAGYTQLIARRYKGKLDADADEFIHFTLDGAQRMRRLIEDLLTYSRVGSREKQRVRTRCDEVLRRAISNLEVAIRESGAELTFTPLPEVLGDEVQLEQLLQNLIGNALKFRAPDTTPRIHVAAERRGSEWVISVRDNGIGIEPRYFERIFAIFQRLHGQDAYSGTGLGLAICKKIVERHGGRIWVESAPGKGSSFCFTLPAIAAEPPAPA